MVKSNIKTRKGKAGCVCDCRYPSPDKTFTPSAMAGYCLLVHHRGYLPCMKLIILLLPITLLVAAIPHAYSNGGGQDKQI